MLVCASCLVKIFTERYNVFANKSVIYCKFDEGIEAFQLFNKKITNSAKFRFKHSVQHNVLTQHKTSLYQLNSL